MASKKKLISIVTAIHNQLAYNQLFYESLMAASYYPVELIIIDNSSTDGSAEFFKSKKNVKVIETGENICYSCAQNLGLKYVKTPYTAFLNNDIYLSKNWDKKLIDYLEEYNLDIISPAGIEAMETEKLTKKYMRKWRRINFIQRLLNYFNISYHSKFLKFLIRLMYGHWDKFVKHREIQFNHFLYSDLRGSAVITRTKLFKKIGLWNKYAMVGPDHELRFRATKNQLEKKQVHSPMIAGDVIFHHFIKATARKKNLQPYTCSHKLLSAEQIITAQDLKKYMHVPNVSFILHNISSKTQLTAWLNKLTEFDDKKKEIIIIGNKQDKSLLHQYQNLIDMPIRFFATPDRFSPEFLDRIIHEARGNYIFLINKNSRIKNITYYYNKRKINMYFNGIKNKKIPTYIGSFRFPEEFGIYKGQYYQIRYFQKYFVTFIIPTKGRQTLLRSLQSLQKQTLPFWQAIVILDGISNPLPDFYDPRIRFIQRRKIGYKNKAAFVRNFGLKSVKTQWTAFLDDDDTLSPNYIKILYNYIRKNPEIKMILFRMKKGKTYIPLPDFDRSKIQIGNIGISFAFSCHILKQHLKFYPSSKEDFILFQKILKKGFPALVVPDITYFVRSKPSAEHLKIPKEKIYKINSKKKEF